VLPSSALFKADSLPYVQFSEKISKMDFFEKSFKNVGTQKKEGVKKISGNKH